SIGGLAPWALRRDLEALRRQDRIREAKSGTSRTEIALLGSEARIEKMKREIFHHDLSGVDETLKNVVERLKVLDSEENATLKKKLADKEMIMPPKHMSEALMREIIRDQFATSMNEFMANMNNEAGGSGGAVGSGGACGSGGTDGNADRTGGSGGTGGNANSVNGAGPTVHELTGCTYVTFTKCDPLPFNRTEGAVVSALRGRALTWWNGKTKAMGI
nr:hypothetical protein [Tanacetum cinerariifolium]